ncbi:uncharacterized protein LOC142349384 isoform X2 [Convolutriloba macropyga]|uniref:uncharacterized protein LOC142349384 isoform X2 n=1 Tax=Convolutriloba macropyga TaxID=536237 RepID=UPI003F51C449
MKSKTMTSFSMTSLLTVTIMTWAVDGQAGKCHTCFSSNPGGNFATDAWEAITAKLGMTDGIEDKMFPNIGQIASLGSHVADDATCTDMDNLDDQSLTVSFTPCLTLFFTIRADDDDKTYFSSVIVIKLEDLFNNPSALGLTDDQLRTMVNDWTEDDIREDVFGSLQVVSQGTTYQTTVTGNVSVCSDSDGCNYIPTDDLFMIWQRIADPQNTAGAEDASEQICEELGERLGKSCVYEVRGVFSVLFNLTMTGGSGLTEDDVEDAYESVRQMVESGDSFGDVGMFLSSGLMGVPPDVTLLPGGKDPRPPPNAANVVSPDPTNTLSDGAGATATTETSTSSSDGTGRSFIVYLVAFLISAIQLEGLR